MDREGTGRKGKLIVIDGIDGSGKSKLVKGLDSYLSSKGLVVGSLTDYCMHTNVLPEPEEFFGVDVLLSNEPTYSYIGLGIRQEITKNNGRHYSAIDTAHAFSMDRLMLYTRVIIPLLQKGKIIINDRSVTTSIVYQPIQAEKLPLGRVLSLSGNRLALEYAPDLLVIADCPPEVAISRLMNRTHKDDNSIFERLEFLKKADERYKSDWFRKIFESRGSQMNYLDTNRKIEEEVNDMIRLYESLSSSSLNKK